MTTGPRAERGSGRRTDASPAGSSEQRQPHEARSIARLTLEVERGRPAVTPRSLLVDLAAEVLHRVGEQAGEADLEVQVRPRGVAGGALETDDVAGVHQLARVHQQPVEVAVQRDHLAGVRDHDVVAITDEVALEVGARAGDDHHAISGRSDWSVQRRGDVNAGMEMWIGDPVEGERWLQRKRGGAETLGDGAELGSEQRRRRRTGAGKGGLLSRLDRRLLGSCASTAWRS